MPRKRYYKTTKKTIAGIQVECKVLYIKTDGRYVKNSNRIHYYLGEKRLYDFTKLEYTCCTCGWNVKSNWRTIKNSDEQRECGLCVKRKDNNFYRPEWHSENGKRKRAVKARQTSLRKYGVTCTLNTEENIKRKKATWLKKYGVDNPTKNKTIRAKQQDSLIKSGKLGFNNKNFYYKSEIFDKTIYYQSTNELDFIKWAETQGNIKDLTRGPMIRVQGVSNAYCVTCDFELIYLNGKRRLVEIKGNHNGWREDKSNGRWHTERYVLEKYSNEHNYLRFYLILNNNENTLRRIENDNH